MSYFQYTEDGKGRANEQELAPRQKRSFTKDEMSPDGNDPTRSFPGTFPNNSPLQEKEGNALKQSFWMFLAMAKPYYRESKRGGWLFSGMIVITLLKSAVSVMFSFIGKDFWNALNSGDADEFYSILWVFAIGETIFLDFLSTNHHTST